MPAVVLYSARRKYLLFLVVALLFVAGGAWMLTQADKPEDRIIGWSCVVFFGAGALLFARMMFDRRPRIVIDDQGVFDRTLKMGPIPWADIVDAQLQTIQSNAFIALALRDPAKHLRKRSKLSQGLMRLNRSLGFSEINLNLSGVKADPSEVLGLIQRRLSDVEVAANPPLRKFTIPARALPAQSYVVRFAGRLSLFDARSNPLRLVGAGSIHLQGDSIRIVGRRWRGFGVTAALERVIPLSEILNVDADGLRVSFEVRPADGTAGFVLGFKAADVAEARAITAALPDLRTVVFAQLHAEQGEFDQRLAQISPTAWVTPTLVLANIAMFAWVALQGGGVITPDSAVMLRWGANHGPLTTDGQWWRLGSSMFLHFGLLHLALNMWALYSSGGLVERLFGSARFLTLYVFAGLTGSIASVLWNPGVISAGASGAIFGVFGGLLAFMLKPQNRVPASVMSGHTKSTLAFVVYNLIFGATQAGIDNAAHLGGLAGGALIGLALARPFDVEVRSKSGWLGYTLIAVAAIALLAALSLPITRPSQAIRNEQAFRRDLHWFDSQEQAAIDRFNQQLTQLRQPAPDYAAIADQLSAEVLPQWQTAHERLASADLASNPHLQAVQKAYLVYVDHRRDAIELIATSLSQDDGEKFKDGEALLKRGDADIEAIKNLRKAGD